MPVLQTTVIEIQQGQDYEVDPTIRETIDANAGRVDALELETPKFVTKSTEQTVEGEFQEIVS